MGKPAEFLKKALAELQDLLLKYWSWTIFSGTE